MKKYISILLVILTWAFSTINTSGWGKIYDTTTKTMFVIGLWFLYESMISKDKILFRYPKLMFFTLLTFVFLPLLMAKSWEGFTYLMMVPLVYCFSKINVTKRFFTLSGFIIAGLGLSTLVIYTQSGILSGWNDNQIGMIGLFSYIYFSISLYGHMSKRKLIIGLFVSALYAIELRQNTNSRSALIFIFIAVLLAYRGSIIRRLASKKYFVFIAISLPLIIALLFVFFPNIPFFRYFNEWSEQTYNKTAFNGRDELWGVAFRNIVNNKFIGEGQFLMNHHNSAVAILDVFGLVGYICWYKMLAKPVSFIKVFISDDLTLGCLSAFLIIFWQQSFDLGFVTPFPNMIPYVILGLALARVNTIRRYGSD